MTGPSDAQVHAGAARLVALGHQQGSALLTNHATHLARQVLEAALADDVAAESPPVPDTRRFDMGFPGEIEPGMAVQWSIWRSGPPRLEWSSWADVIAVDGEAMAHPTANPPANTDNMGHRCVLLRFEDGSERAMWFERGGITRLARRHEAKAWYAANLPGIDRGDAA